MRVRASAPGKLIVLGEYAVLEGAPAVVTAVQRRAEVCVTVSEGHGIVVDAPEIGVQAQALTVPDQGAKLEGQLAFVQACVADVWSRASHLRSKQIDIAISSERFLATQGGPKLGLGSSAAVSAALVTALEVAGAGGRKPEPVSVFESAHRAHRWAQGGMGSGLDVAASSFGGMVAMFPGDKERPTRCTPLNLPEGIEILPVYTGRGASTTALVRVVREYATQEPEGYARLIAAMADCSRKAIESRSVKEFLEANESYGRWLAELGSVSGADIVSEPHRKLAKVAADAGLIYKSSGAGGGDIGLVFAERPEQLDTIREALKQAGGTPLDLELGGVGVDFTLG